ncbi:MAG: ABC transporter permease [Bradymonadaceae bacterium]|nr:ABC transporter permease [Lujinxingiaceae bacterium]
MSAEPHIEQPQTTSAAHNLLASVGEPILMIARTVREIFEMFSLTLYYVVRGRKRWPAIFEQMYDVGNRSILFIAVTLGFLGMILIFQAGNQALQITGDLQVLGGLFLQLLLREFAPTIAAMMIATRVATGMAAQIGSMVVTEQVDALQMCAAQPVDYLVVPRFIACTIMMVILTIFAVLVAYVCGAFTAYMAFNLNPRTFIDLGFITWFDPIIGLVKAFAYGMAIPIIACHAGLNVFGGSEGVGRATTQAVVNASLAVVILDFIISGLGYVVLGLL